MPLWLDLDGGIRVVHACWHALSMAIVERALVDGGLGTDGFFVEAATKNTELYDAFEILFKGPELTLLNYDLPPFYDKDGNRRTGARIRWWNTEATAVHDLAEIPPGSLQEDRSLYPKIPPDILCKDRDLKYRYRESEPVFFGHYWRLWPPQPFLDWAPATASVDFSAGAGGPLVAYRWSGEAELSPENFVAFP